MRRKPGPSKPKTGPRRPAKGAPSRQSRAPAAKGPPKAKPARQAASRAKPATRSGAEAAQQQRPGLRPGVPPAPDARPGRKGAPVKATPARARGLWIWGRHAVEAALGNPSRSCHRLLATPEALERLGQVAHRPGLEVVVAERAELERRLGEGTVHQGLALSAAPLPRVDLERACAPESDRNVVLVLDQINDPHNLGAILRTAAAFDVRAVVVPERRSAELGGVVAKAASGALDRVPVVDVVNVARALQELAELGYWRLALDADAEATIGDVPDDPNLALVLGAEGTGLRRLVAERCDFAARLPIAPAMESFNVSVACGIALYALARRREARREAR